MYTRNIRLDEPVYTHLQQAVRWFPLMPASYFLIDKSRNSWTLKLAVFSHSKNNLNSWIFDQTQSFYMHLGSLLALYYSRQFLDFLKTALLYCHVLPVSTGGFTTVGAFGVFGARGGF